MRYLMKQKLFCLGDDFCIKDEQGRGVFVVAGKVFSLGEKLAFQDMAGNELAFISQKLLSWGPTYEIYRGSELAAVVKRSPFGLFHTKFTIDAPGADELEVDGDFLGHEYRVSRGGALIADVSKQWFTLSDTYGVEIADGNDEILLLAVTVVIDMVCHGDHKERSS